MVFIRDTEQSLKAAVYLVNTLPGFDDDDTLQTIADFESYLAVNPYTGAIRRDETELAAVRAIRPRLRALWDVEREGADGQDRMLCLHNVSAEEVEVQLGDGIETGLAPFAHRWQFIS